MTIRKANGMNFTNTLRTIIIGGFLMIDLLNADCNKVMPEIKNKYSNENIVFVSDPPFNIGYKYNTYKDKMNEQDYYSMIESLFKGFPSVIIHYPEALYKMALCFGYAPQRVVSWVYNSNTSRQHRDIAFWNVKPNFNQVLQPYKNIKDKRIQQRIADGKIGCKLYDWWNINQVKNISKEKTAHPCQMPLEVMRNIIGLLPKGCLIIDPFMGSGTTGLACKQMNYDFIGIEMDAKYYQIAFDRIKGA